MKIAIYTCVVGDYDELRQPLVIDNTYDYICFSNDIKEGNVGVWQIHPIPFSCKSKARLSRYVKLLPHKVLGEYDWSLWIDANVQITGNELYRILYEKIQSGGKSFQVNHCFPPCDCIYEEIKYACSLGRVTIFSAYRQYKHLKKMLFPAHLGLYENNILLRCHNDPDMIMISEDWWSEFCSFSKRDQFSLMYIYWKHNFKSELLFPEGFCTRNVPFLSWNYHKARKMSLFDKLLSHLNLFINNSFLFLLR